MRTGLLMYSLKALVSMPKQEERPSQATTNPNGPAVYAECKSYCYANYGGLR